MNCRQTCKAIVCFLALVVLVNVANAQSKDQDNPTPLTSSVISDTLSPDKNGETYYYSFVAGPGDIIVTLTVEGIDNVVQAGFAVFDGNEVQLAKKYATTYRGNSSQAVEKIYVKRRQRVVLSVIIQNNAGSGRYRLRIGGDVEFGQNRSSSGVTGSTATDPIAPKTHPECLSKQGTLIIKMKDGSKKIIDLSEAETITGVP